MIKSDGETRTYQRAYGRRIEKYLTKSLQDMAESRDRFSIQLLAQQLAESAAIIREKLGSGDVVSIGDADLKRR